MRGEQRAQTAAQLQWEPIETLGRIANYCFQNGGLETKMAAQSRNVQAMHSTQARKLVTCSYAYKANFIQ